MPHVLVALHDIVAEPAATPLTTPAALTVATAVLALLQVVPVDERVVLAPTATEEVPVMALTVGSGFTVTALVTGVAPQVLVTV